jgi:hypothetical protein
MKTSVIVLFYLAALAVVCQFATVFGVVTLVTAFLVFSKIEADQNVYDLGFWFTRFPSSSVLAWFRAFGRLESIVRSFLLALLAWFTFAGEDQGRVFRSTLQLCSAVTVSFLLLSILTRKAHLNVLRWAYVKLSVFVGVVLSIVAVLFRTPGRGSFEIAGDWLKSWRPDWLGGSGSDFDGKVDGVHTVINDATEWIHGKLDDAAGEPLASIFMVILNSEILQGFLVVLFSFPLLLFTFPELRRRPEDSGSEPREKVNPGAEARLSSAAPGGKEAALGEGSADLPRWDG